MPEESIVHETQICANGKTKCIFILPQNGDNSTQRQVAIERKKTRDVSGKK